ncbi:restriction endonuclease subunit S [[Ruminococcus] torques]|jgi:type I restriction enzyme S subunit
MELRNMTLASLSVDGRGSYGIAASAVDRSDELYTYLRITDIRDDGTLNMADLKSVDDEKASQYLLKPNDIVFARTGASTGRNYFYDGTDGEFVYAGFLIKFSIDPVKVNPQFIKYYCMSDAYKGWVHSYNTGSTRGNINARTLGGMVIPVPPRQQQDGMVSILSALDAKIKNNIEINENLAELLQTVYQERFGDVSTATEQGILSDICYYSRDRVVVSKLNASTYFSTENMLPEKAGANEAASLPNTLQTTACHKGDTLISNIRPYFKKIVYCEDGCGCSTDVLCFTPVQPKYAAYLFSTLYADKFFAFMVAGSKGTKMPRGDKQQIMTYPVALPSDEELDEFNSLALPILAQLHSNKAESKRLSATRDALLPKLMSGEIDVSGIQL